MRKFLLATTLVFAATSAHAATISIGYELPSFTPGAITMVGHEVNPVFGSVSASGFGENTWTSTSSGWAPTTTHLVGDVHVNVTNPNVMNSFSVYITMSDIPFQQGDINPVTIINDMTASWTGPSLDGWILNFTTYIDPDNRIFEKQIYLNGGPKVFDPATTPTTEHYVSTFPYNLPASQPPFADLVPGQFYSVTQFYSFVDPPAPVPGPVVGAGLPGLATLGMWLLWRRRRSA
jgi:hypothetical protein